MAVWFETIDFSDFWHSSSISFEGKRDMAVERLRDSIWLRYSEGEPVVDVVNQLAETTTPESFSVVMDELYDYADADRVWIGTMFPGPPVKK